MSACPLRWGQGEDRSSFPHFRPRFTSCSKNFFPSMWTGAFIFKIMPKRFIVFTNVENKTLPSFLFLGTVLPVQEKPLICIRLSSAELSYQSRADICFWVCIGDLCFPRLSTTSSEISKLLLYICEETSVEYVFINPTKPLLNTHFPPLQPLSESTKWIQSHSYFFLIRFARYFLFY